MTENMFHLQQEIFRYLFYREFNLLMYSELNRVRRAIATAVKMLAVSCWCPVRDTKHFLTLKNVHF